MSLQQWAENGWLRPHQTSTQEIGDSPQKTQKDKKHKENPFVSFALLCFLW
jgi:hypothetical protein